MPKPDSPIGKIARALVHPVRLRMLIALAVRDASAKNLSDEFGDVKLNEVDYHMKVLKDCELIELVDHRRVRGAREHFYRLRPWSDLAGAWATVPRSVSLAYRSALFSRFIDALHAAARSGLLERKTTALEARPVTVDGKGWAEIGTASAEFSERVGQIEAQSRSRLKGAGRDAAIHGIVGHAAFETTNQAEG